MNWQQKIWIDLTLSTWENEEFYQGTFPNDEHMLKWLHHGSRRLGEEDLHDWLKENAQIYSTTDHFRAWHQVKQ